MLKKLFDKNHRTRTTTYLLVAVLYVVLIVLMNMHKLSSLMTSLLVPVCCYIVAGIGLNLNVGISGELNLGQAGFMSVGGFTAVCISAFLAPMIPSPILRLVLAIIAGTIVAAIFGYFIGIPVLKLQGDYLAIVTLAFGQIVMSLLNNLYVGLDEKGFHMSFVNNTMNMSEEGRILINGPMGANGTERISTFTMGVILIVIALVVVYNLLKSKSGRAIMAARDNRIAAESVGINVTNTKMLAFVISAALAGAAGALFGLNFSTLIPNTFNFNTSILILVFVVLGGLGNMKGTIIATILLMVLPEMLRSLQDYRMIIYAIVLITIMLVSNNQTVKEFVGRLKNQFLPKGVKKNG